MTQLNLTVALPPGFLSGTYELLPYDAYAVAGAATVTTSFQGIISGAGVLTASDGSPATVIVPPSGGYDAGRGLLRTHFKTTVGLVEGRQMIIPLVETSPGVMDVAYLLSVGRAQVLTAQQAADIEALIAGTTAARDSALDAADKALDAASANTDGLTSATAAANAAAGLTSVSTYAAIPPVNGYYRVLNGPEAGQVYQRSSGVLVRRSDLEAVSQDAVTARLRAETVASLKTGVGSARGDIRAINGRMYWWDDLDVRADDGGAILVPAGNPAMGRWRLYEREWGIPLTAYSYLIGPDGDMIDALTAALAVDSVRLPLGENLFKPTLTHFVKVPVGVPRTISGMGPGSRIKIMDGTGDYQRLFGSADDTQKLVSIRLSNFCIDQNPDNNVGTIVNSSAPTAQQAIGFYNFDGVDLDRLTILGTGINTISLNGGTTGSQNARVRDCDITWANKGGVAATYDNSAIYINCEGHWVTLNKIRARSAAEGAIGAVETHGAVGQVSYNQITDFQVMINIVPFSSGMTELTTSSQTVNGNIGTRVGIGVQLWPITGKTMRNIKIFDQTIVIAQDQYPTLLEPRGIYVIFNIGGKLNGDVDGLDIYSNLVIFQPTETRSNLSYNSMAGIGLAGNGNISNANIYHNTVVNAPLSSFVYGRAGKTMTHLRAWNNKSLNAGTAKNQAQGTLRVGVNVQGLHIDTFIDRFQFMEDTATPQANSLAYFSLTAGSDVTFDSTRISAPNNPAIVVPTSPPAGVSFGGGGTVPAIPTLAYNTGVTGTLTLVSGSTVTADSNALRPRYRLQYTWTPSATTASLTRLLLTGPAGYQLSQISVSGIDNNTPRTMSWIPTGGVADCYVYFNNPAASAGTVTINIIVGYSK